MNEEDVKAFLGKLSDQLLTNLYCREQLKCKADLHLKRKGIDFGEPNRPLTKLCRAELKRRGLIIPFISIPREVRIQPTRVNQSSW